MNREQVLALLQTYQIDLEALEVKSLERFGFGARNQTVSIAHTYFF